MATQKAIAVVEVGKPVQLIERAIPEPGANEVLVRVSTAGRESTTQPPFNFPTPPAPITSPQH